jgi:hypothetical protein
LLKIKLDIFNEQNRSKTEPKDQNYILADHLRAGMQKYKIFAPDFASKND